MTVRFTFYLYFLLFTQVALAKDGQAVSALGRLEPEFGIVRIAAPSTPEAILGGLLFELLVSEGDDVETGQLLAVTDTAAVKNAQVAEAEMGLELARRQVDASRSMATEACVRADVAAQEADRRARLQAQGVAGEEEAESARGEADARKASCASASTDIRLAETTVEVALAHLRRVQAEAQRSYIRAPFPGRVLEIIAQPGELVSEKGILELGRVNQMQAIAEVYETDIQNVRLGQRATVNSPALGQELSGSVSSIRPKVQKQDEIGTDPAARKDARIVEVFITLDDSRPAASLTNLQVDVVFQP